MSFLLRVYTNDTMLSKAEREFCVQVDDIVVQL